MNETDAHDTFEKYLTSECPTCQTPAGQLCNTPGVWIHYDRMAAYFEGERA